jgi:bifunctional DNA-binding transcriptional regulator/antitoxin component of YhaV-PrlF toxin-antitoxin module
MKEHERMTRMVRQLRSGQITIPAEFRRALGIERDTVLRMTLEGGELRIRPVPMTETAKDSAWFRKLYDAFEPARQEAEQKHYTEEEINTAIDQAVAAVRRKHG